MISAGQGLPTTLSVWLALGIICAAMVVTMAAGWRLNNMRTQGPQHQPFNLEKFGLERDQSAGDSGPELVNQSRETTLRTPNLTPPPLSYLPTSYLKILTLGYWGLYEDFLHLWSLQVLLDPGIKMVAPEDLGRFIRFSSQHRPRIETFYMLSCFTMAFDLKAPGQCEDITLAGLKAQPHSWRIPVIQGYLELRSLGQPSKAQLYYRLAASKPNAPKFLGSLASKLASGTVGNDRGFDNSLDLALPRPSP